LANKEDVIELEGTVIDVVRNDIKVQLANGHIVVAYPAGKLRMYNIKIIAGDKVKVELSPYDLTKGRITYRTTKTNWSEN